MPTKRLPDAAHLDHLKAQARALLEARAHADPAACQRLREFHPRFATAADGDIAIAAMSWSDALFAIAREYGFASWPRLKRAVDGPATGDQSFVERIADPVLRQGVELVDDGDADGLRALLRRRPDLVTRRAAFEGENYFRTPALIAFVAENPTRNEALPPNIVEIAQILIDAGAQRADIEETLGLVASGRVARECGVQGALIALLCRAGADANTALLPALAHGEFDAANALREAGATPTLTLAAATGDRDLAEKEIAAADEASKQAALSLAALHGRAEIVRLLLQHGADADRYNPAGLHAHSTPLHQAAFAGHLDAVRTLIEHGARTDLRDTHWSGTALDWARHGEHAEVAAYLEGR